MVIILDSLIRRNGWIFISNCQCALDFQINLNNLVKLTYQHYADYIVKMINARQKHNHWSDDSEHFYGVIISITGSQIRQRKMFRSVDSNV